MSLLKHGVLLVWFLGIFVPLDTSSGQELYPSNCKNLEDGTYQLKLLDNEYPVVTVKCSNGYIMLDISLDENLKSYFDTFQQFHLHTGGPESTVHKVWQEWFLPTSGLSSDDTSFLVSKDCSSCDITNGYNALGDDTTYYMSGSLFGCFWTIGGNEKCDIEPNSYDCRSCYQGVTEDAILLTDDNIKSYWGTEDLDSLLKFTGICPTLIRSSTYPVPTLHDQCTDGSSMQDHVKPSIGIHGNNCVCYKTAKNTNYFVGTESEDVDENVVISEDKIHTSVVVELYQDDFSSGTLRIQDPGIYKIMEDIYFDFNGITDENDEDFETNIDGWKPLASQVDDYPGAGGYIDTYFLGFFAGIAIESDNVVIDLNDHTIAMSDKFYYQQRWFTCIELSKQYFWTGQGIANFGYEPHASKNLIIKNGNIGLTSHHGIHGNYNDNLLLSNINVYDFETHGIQLNGFSNVHLTDVNVGPTSSKVYLNGEYGHWRYLLPRLKAITEEVEDDSISFYGRDSSTSLSEIYEEIKNKMSYAWNYVVYNKKYKKGHDEYEDFVDAINLFVNNKGLPYATAQYGIFLNTKGASVFTYNLGVTSWSYNARLDNVKIHGLRHDMSEYLRFFRSNTIDNYRMPFNGPLDAFNMVEDWDNFVLDDLQNGKISYYGNILTDALIGMNYLSNNFGYLGAQSIQNDELVKWALFNNADGITEIGIGSNSDVMLHSGKGMIGLRIDGVNGVDINGLEIYDLYDSTYFGTDITGAYDWLPFSDNSGGHFSQRLPMQTGYSGNINHGVHVCASKDVTFTNVKIHDLSSKYGHVFAIAIWPGNSNIQFKGTNDIYNLYAGINVKEDALTYESRPNIAPEACGIRVYHYYEEGGLNIYQTSIETSDNDNLDANYYCIDGQVGCYDGNYDDTINEDQTIADIINFDTYSMIGSEDTSKKCTSSIHLKETANKLHDNEKYPTIRSRNFGNYKTQKFSDYEGKSSKKTKNKNKSSGSILYIGIVLAIIIPILAAFAYLICDAHTSSKAQQFQYAKIPTIYGSINEVS